MASGEDHNDDLPEPHDGEGTGTLTLEDADVQYDVATPEETPEELLYTCSDLRNTGAWDRFLERFHPLIVATVVRTLRRYGRGESGLRDDLVQEVYVKFSAKRARVLREFKPRYTGAVFGFLKVIAANVVHDHFKSKWGKTLEQQKEVTSDVPDNDEVEWRILLRDIDDLLKQPPISPRDRQIFWLYYRQGLSAKEIAEISVLNLSIKGVEAVIVRLNQFVRNAFAKGKRQLGGGIVS